MPEEERGAARCARFSSCVALALLMCCCRGRAAPVRAGASAPVRVPDAAQVVPTGRPETAALLLVGKEGAAQVVCLPKRDQARDLFPGIKVLHVQDAMWKSGRLTVAALTGPSGSRQHLPDGQLVLLSPGVAPRRVAQGASLARFSPDGTALLFQTASRGHAGGGAVVDLASSHVLDLASGMIEELADMVDALWEADSKHVRATRLTKTLDERGASATVRWTSLRVRWDRDSRTVAVVGRGSAQIPAPQGSAVAWSEDQRSALLPSHCAVWIGTGRGHQHPTIGPFCMGIADDRGTRWSPDGRWLAFARPGPKRVERGPTSFFVDVVGVAGGRHPGMAELLTQLDPSQTDIAARESAPWLWPGIWMDWSPSGERLAVQDGAGDVRVFDLQGHTVSFLGKGERPAWSPGGGYLHILTTGSQPAGTFEAFVLPGGSRAAMVALGMVRDTHWLPSEACARP